MEEKDTLFEQRLNKLNELKKEGINPYPNDFRVGYTTGEIREKFKDSTPEDLKKVEEIFSLAGRIMAIRSFGKASFMHIQDRKGKVQVYLRKDILGEEGFRLFEKMDLGEIVIITRHKGIVEWLRRRGITGEVIEHATKDDVEGKNVFVFIEQQSFMVMVQW